MYWVHRFGRGRRSKEFNDSLDISAMCYLLEKRNCLTVGWLCFSDNQNIVNAVESGNTSQVMNLMLNEGITGSWAKSLINFTKMTSGDIAVVLPNKNYFPYFFVVEIVSTHAKSILNSPQNMTANFNINSLDYNFSANSGWTRMPRNTAFDVGFFHEVKIWADKLPRDLIGSMFNHFRSTNSPVYDVSKQKYIENLIPKT